MKSLSELLRQLGLEPDGQTEALNGLRVLNQIRSEGSVVVVKLDGQRTENCYTVVISDGLLGEDYFRKDGSNLDELIKEGVNFYDGLIWSGGGPPPPDST